MKGVLWLSLLHILIFEFALCILNFLFCSFLLAHYREGKKEKERKNNPKKLQQPREIAIATAYKTTLDTNVFWALCDNRWIIERELTNAMQASVYLFSWSCRTALCQEYSFFKDSFSHPTFFIILCHPAFLNRHFSTSSSLFPHFSIKTMNPPSLKQSASDFVTLLNSQNIKAKFDQMRKDQVQSEFNAALYPYADSVSPSVVDSTAAGLIGGVSLQNNQSMDGIALQNNPSVGGLSLQNNPSMAGISLQNNPSISGISLRNNPIHESPQHLGQSLNDLRLNHATTVDAASSSAFACDLNDDVFAPKTAAATVSPHSLLSFSASKMPSPTPANSPYHSMGDSVG